MSSGRPVYVQQLEDFKDRLLRVNWSNRSILLRKTQKKWTFDLGEFDEKISLHIVERMLSGKRDFFLVSDNSLNESDIEWKSQLVALHRQEDLIEEESGIHDLFIGFPFLYGNLSPQHYVRSPLILFPCRLEHRKDNRQSGWYLIFEEGQPPIWNHTLFAALHRVGEMSIPDSLDDDLEDLIEGLREKKDYTIVSYFESIAKLFAKYSLPFRVADSTPNIQKLDPLKKEQISNLRVESLSICSNIVLGIFPQAADTIYQDYEALIDNSSKNSNDMGVLGKILQIPTDQLEDDDRDAPFNLEERLDKTPDLELNSTLESDASQDAIIMESQKSECVVVRGPPGTGKSQLIVNLISSALSKGERVAVVCQKRAALGVVSERLEKIGLAQFALLVQDEKRDRKTSYERLHLLLTNDKWRTFANADSELKHTSEEIDSSISELNQLVIPQWEIYFDGLRLVELYQKVIPNYQPPLFLSGQELKIDYHGLEQLLMKIPYLEKETRKFDGKFYPFSTRSDFSKLDAQDKERLDTDLRSVYPKTSKEYYSLPSLSSYDRAIRNMTTYQTLHKSVTRKFRSEWRDFGSGGEKFLIENKIPLDDVNALTIFLSKLEAGRELLLSISGLERYLGKAAIDGLVLLSSDSEKLQKWFLQAIDATKDFDELQNYDGFVSKLDPIEISIFHTCKLQLSNIEDWSTALRQHVFLQWIEFIEKKNPQLKGNPFEKYVKLRDRLQELVRKKSGLVSAKVSEDIFRRASSARQLVRTFHSPDQLGWDWKKFDHELTKTRRVRPMRKLFEAYEPLVKLVAPCWLVSPEMLSRVIPLEREFFDLVIFDEASQLSVENSLPALYRAKRVVIAGDEKQLQPFDLFNIQNSDEDEDEEESSEITRAESLLMLAKRTFHFRYLSWHYRSESQELIDFSNYAFYKGQLSIAGNVNRKSTEPAIHWVNCNGTWNDRSNIPEAEVVVDQIGDLLSREGPSKESPSIGVVTFNDAQREQILTSITSRTEKDPVFNEFYSRSEAIAKTRPDKKLFVKNIENVQGDERDVIIFSIGYAKDPLGNFSIRFGSLNREGGENRLNVAVTRARKEIIVCCSFDPADLPVELSKYEGPKLLKDYLLYAKAVSEGNSTSVKDILAKLAQESFDRKIIESSIGNVFESPLEEQVYDALSALGYAIDTQVGYSAYKIDLGVVHPKNPNKYVLAIECDGATFHSAKSSRERDLVRQRFLESRGWKVERIWSRNWWRNRDGELQRLRERIEKESMGDPPLIKR